MTVVRTKRCLDLICENSPLSDRRDSEKNMHYSHRAQLIFKYKTQNKNRSYEELASSQSKILKGISDCEKASEEYITETCIH